MDDNVSDLRERMARVETLIAERLPAQQTPAPATVGGGIPSELQPAAVVGQPPDDRWSRAGNVREGETSAAGLVAARPHEPMPGINAAPERAVRAVFSTVRGPDPKPRKPAAKQTRRCWRWPTRRSAC